MNTDVVAQILFKYRENKLAHAYLIETNNFSKALNDLKTLIKNLNCPETYNQECQNCNLCNLINIENLPSLKIIEPDGAFIKKEQIEALKEEFSTIPIYSKYNVYIIKNAEKLTSSSANSMLKFVEEPTPGIIGFFLTTNKSLIIDTIKSRCQIYTLEYADESILAKLHLSEEEYNSYIAVIKDYLNFLYSYKPINHKNIILNQYSDKKALENIFNIIFAIYYEHFLKLSHEKYQENITNIYPLKENIVKLQQEMQIITKILTNMRYNVSIELMLDEFAIEMRGVYE